jgi:hypothetical protein
LDENLDWRLGRGLVEHEVESVDDWDGPAKRGIVKTVEQTGFEVLITLDSNMTFQLNLVDQRLKRSTQQASCGYDPADAKSLVDAALGRKRNSD